MKDLIIFIGLFTLPIVASASYQCDISVRKAMTESLLKSDAVKERSKVVQVNAATNIGECQKITLELIKERCKEQFGGKFISAYVKYTESNASDYETNAVIKGYCRPSSYLSKFGGAKGGFDEFERIGFIRKKY